MLAKAASAFDAIDGLRTVIAKATQLQDHAQSKASQVNLEVTKWEVKAKLTLQNIEAFKNYNVELGLPSRHLQPAHLTALPAVEHLQILLRQAS